MITIRETRITHIKAVKNKKKLQEKKEVNKKCNDDYHEMKRVGYFRADFLRNNINSTLLFIPDCSYLTVLHEEMLKERCG